MKITSTINRTRAALKRLTLGLAVSTAVVFGTGLTLGQTPPGGVTDLVLWLDASAPDTMTVVAGTVNEWRDKLGSAAKMTRDHGAPTVVASGIGEIPTVHFSASSMGDGVNHEAPVTILYVSRQTGGSNGRVLSGGNNWLLGYWGGKKGSAYFNGDVLLNGTGPSDTNPHLYATTIPGSGSDSTVWAEGVQIASNQGGTAGPNGLFVGGGGAYAEYSNCDVSEVLVYNRILDSTELDAIGGYLAAKYFLTTSYPTDLTVRLTSPANNQAYPSGTSISATAGVFSGTAPYTVKLFTRSLLGGTFAQAGADLTTSPYTVNLGTLSNGSYEIYATVTDSATPTPVTATSGTNTFTVAPGIPTTTTVASSGSPTTYGQSVTFTATVAPPPTGGTVQFYDGVVALGDPVAVNITTGQATYLTTTLGAGTHGITAKYSGYQVSEASTSAVLTQVVNKAGLTVLAANMLRLPNTANPNFVYEVTGFKNGQNLGTSGVTGTPALTTDAIITSPVGEYTIYCAVGTLAAANYSFVTFVNGTLTVADVADTFGVNFYADASDPLSQIKPGIPAGFDDWFTPGWYNRAAPWGGGLQPPVKLTSNKSSTSTFIFKNTRNGGTTTDNPRTTNLGDGNYTLMAAIAHGTEDGGYIFDMEMTDIPFGIYDVIFYMGSSSWNNNRTGTIVFNGAPEPFIIQGGSYDGTFTEMVDATTPGNYIVYTNVTGPSFTAQVYGDGFNHIGVAGFQIRESATPQANIKAFGPGAVIGPMVANKADIAWTVLYGTDLAHLAPIFTLSPGAACKVGGNTVNSGDPVNFSAGPVDYTVTSSDSTIVNVYTVTVSVAPPSSANDILTCDIGGTNIAVFKYENIYLKVPAGTSVASLPVNYTVSPGASGAPASGTPRDFTTAQTQTYTITAQDGSTKDYTITVIVDGPPVLIGHWASGAESLTDSSGYTPAGTHDGVAMGDNAGLLAWSSDVPVGFTGKSLDLSAGSVAVQIDNTATNDSAYRTTFDQGIGTKFTTTFWFKGPVDTLTGVWVSKSGNTPYGWKARPLNGTLPVVNVDFTMRDNTGDAPTPSALQTSGVSVNDGAWHHVAEVLDGWNPSFRKVYVDGVLRAQSTGTNNPVNIANLSHLLLGATQGQSPQVPDATIGVPGGFFTGQLYGVRIYNGPLTAAEIDSVYSRRPILKGITGPGAGGFTIQGSTAYAGDLVTMKATNLSPPNWTPIQTNAVPIGSFSITLPQGADSQAFYRLMSQ